MNFPTVAVIMAGGSGERFWPLSRRARPKQLLRLADEQRSLLEEALDRITGLAPVDRMFIAANTLLQEPIRRALPEFPPDQVLGEPERRNTTGCLAYAAAHILARLEETSEDILMACVTADHRIDDLEIFHRTLQAALAFARENDALLVVGIEPTRPETGYGYIEIADLSRPAAEPEGVPIHPVSRFHEKPPRSEAERYLASDRFYWNSGMFFWRISVFMAALDRYLPEVSRAVREMRDELRKPEPNATRIAEIFQRLPNLSIDFGLMEKANNIFMAPGHFAWDDVGSWDSLPRIWPQDEHGNVSVGDPVLIDCRNVTVYNEPGAEKLAVGVLGMENVVVVATADGILVCPRDRGQEVRKIVDRLKEKNAGQL